MTIFPLYRGEGGGKVLVMDKKDTEHKLHWHPAFLQAMQVELLDYKDSLEFREEYYLTAEPLRIDLLIIKKPKDLHIDKNFARIFRSDNILEYKSPDDNLSVRDFWKVCAYANLYASITADVELSDITLTFVVGRHPDKFLRYLTGVRGYTVEKTSPGIYKVTGDYLPIQIIETKKLSKKENLCLESIRKGLKESNLRAILEEGEKWAREINIDAYMDVVLRANNKALSEVYKMTAPTLEEILTEIGFLPDWEKRKIQQGREEARGEILELLSKGYTLDAIKEELARPVVSSPSA